MRSEGLEHVEVLRRTSVYADVDGHWLGPLEVRECAVDIAPGILPKLEAGPEGWTGYEGRAPIPTDLRGCDEIALTGAAFENSRQYLRRKPVDRNKRVLDRPGCLQNLREVMFDAIDLRKVEQSATSNRSYRDPKISDLLRFQTKKLSGEWTEQGRWHGI